jgi:hypothetical protein
MKSNTPVEGVECVIGDEHFVLESVLVDQVIECAVSPLPLALSRWPISGLAIWGESIVVSVRLGSASESERPTGRRERVKAVLLVGQRTDGARWAVEVDEVRSFVRVEVEAGPNDGGQYFVPASLVCSAHETTSRRSVSLASGERRLSWLDAERLIDDLDAEAAQ